MMHERTEILASQTLFIFKAKSFMFSTFKEKLFSLPRNTTKYINSKGKTFKNRIIDFVQGHRVKLSCELMMRSSSTRHSFEDT